MASEDDTRVCSRCEQAKPISQFDARFINKGTRLTCAECRAVDQERRAQEMARWRQEEIERQAERDAIEIRDRKFQLRMARLGKELKRMNLAEEERDSVYYSAVRVGSLGPETWTQAKAIYWTLKPPYELEMAQRTRAKITRKLKLEMFERQQGCCAYCGCKLLALGERVQSPDGLDEAKEALNVVWFAASGGHLRYDAQAERFVPDVPPDCPEYLRVKTLEDEWESRRLAQPNVEHIIPVRRGGTEDPENLVLACWGCNGLKGIRTGEEFLEMPNDPLTQLQVLGMPLELMATAINCEARYASIYTSVCEDLWAIRALAPGVPAPIF